MKALLVTLFVTALAFEASGQARKDIRGREQRTF
jgi:hypothetical protein